MLEEAGLRLAAGEPLPEALPESAWLSPLVRALLARPGSRDSLAAGFGRLADFYEGEIERLGRRLAMVTEVVAIGVAGLAAGFLVIAMWKLYFDACGRFLD